MLGYLAVFAIAFATAIGLTPLARWLSFRWQLLAIPGERRKHTGKVPILGGLPLCVAYGIAAITAVFIFPIDPNTLDGQYLRGVLLGSLIVFIGGIIDDWRELSSGWQFLIQFVATAVAMSHELFIERFTNPFTGQEVAIPWTAVIFALTLLWMVGLINVVNWLDGLDGLATGVGTIALILFAWHGINLGQTTVPAFPIALAGALLGFLIFNFAPARIFLGTAGVFLIGYNLATLAILSPAKISTALLALALPILDGVWLVIDRIRHGQSPLKGDRRHLHFRLSDSGLSTRRIVVGYYIGAIAFGLVGVVASSAWVKIGILAALGTAVLIFLIWLSHKLEP